MYTLESLQQKNLKELKEIGQQLSVLPDGDRRCRQNWIKALVGIQPPLLQLLEVSPGAEVEPVQEAIESKFGRIVYPKVSKSAIALADNSTPETNETRAAADRLGAADTDLHNSRLHTAESDGDSSSIQAEALGSQKGSQLLAAARGIERGRGRTLLDRPNELAASFNDEQPPNRGEGKGRLEIESELSQSAIVSPGVTRKTSTAHQLLELFKSSAVILEDSPATETEAEVLESAIVSAAKNLPRSESDLNPILTGVTFSDNFLARYSPPKPENIHYQADADGQLSLLNFEVESVDEPPDPDDFESLDAFREAIARWDSEHEVNPIDNEPLEVSLDSFCEWAPCPYDWYEPDTLLELSEVSELSPAPESSITCNFFIPTFDAWSDRANRQTDSDEPPDTGNFARLPGPKPPKFPPRAIGQSHDRHMNSESERYCITYCMAAAGSSRSGRAPPGGDAM